MGSNNDEYVNGFSTTTHTLVDPGSEDSVSVNQEKPSIPDCKREISRPNGVQSQDFGDGLIRVDEGDRLFGMIQERFFGGWGPLRAHSRVVAIHKYASSGFTGQARLRSFQIFKEAMEKKCDGNANVKLTWYGASKNEIRKIISHGFGYYGKSEPKSDELYGRGIYLYHKKWSIRSVKSSIADEDGLRHVLLCRVILGKTEIVHPGSEQCHPSSEEFDSGVDNLPDPQKYIVWSTHMNTHILPEYVISFKAPSCLKALEGCPISAILYVLPKYLSPHTFSLISKYYNDCLEKKISHHELIQRMRKLAGDKLLTAVINSYKDMILQDSMRKEMEGAVM